MNSQPRNNSYIDKSMNFHVYAASCRCVSSTCNANSGRKLLTLAQKMAWHPSWTGNCIQDCICISCGHKYCRVCGVGGSGTPVCSLIHQSEQDVRRGRCTTPFTYVSVLVCGSCYSVNMLFGAGSFKNSSQTLVCNTCPDLIPKHTRTKHC